MAKLIKILGVAGEVLWRNPDHIAGVDEVGAPQKEELDNKIALAESMLADAGTGKERLQEQIDQMRIMRDAVSYITTSRGDTIASIMTAAQIDIMMRG